MVLGIFILALMLAGCGNGTATCFNTPDGKLCCYEVDGRGEVVSGAYCY